MANEGGEWIMKGLDWDNPYRIRSWRELINWINEVGFLPLFANEVPGFSAEEQVSPLFWWTGDPEQDPWVWREIIPSTGEVAYGKFFNNKTGFISREWFPYFANARRDGYDFDAAWDDELVQRRNKAIMDVFQDGGMYPGFELKPAAGFVKKVIKISMAASHSCRCRPISLSVSSSGAKTSAARATAWQSPTTRSRRTSGATSI